jgi:hypothetical protein
MRCPPCRWLLGLRVISRPSSLRQRKEGVGLSNGAPQEPRSKLVRVGLGLEERDLATRTFWSTRTGSGRRGGRRWALRSSSQTARWSINGWDRLWAVSSRLTVALADVLNARAVSRAAAEADAPGLRRKLFQRRPRRDGSEEG